MKEFFGKKILIVEDDPDLREVLIDHFSLVGCQVQAAENANEAVALFEKNYFDFILSDMRMPKGDGRFLAQKLAQLRIDPTPLLFLYSGYNDISEQEAQSLGIVEIYRKPMNIVEMSQSIAAHLQARNK